MLTSQLVSSSHGQMPALKCPPRQQGFLWVLSLIPQISITNPFSTFQNVLPLFSPFLKNMSSHQLFFIVLASDSHIYIIGECIYRFSCVAAPKSEKSRKHFLCLLLSLKPQYVNSTCPKLAYKTPLPSLEQKLFQFSDFMIY